MSKKHLSLSKAGIAAAAALLTLSGCTGGGEQDEESPPPQSAEPAPANPGNSDPSDGGGDEAPQELTDEERERIEEQMAPGDVSEEQLEAIRAYLNVRENSESVRYDDVTAWEDALKKVTTDTGYETAVEMYHPGETSNARNVGADQSYEVRVAVGACYETPGFGGGEDVVAVQCELTDLVEDDEGLVPSQDVDNTWPYYGEQQSPTLVIAKDGDEWLVDGDYTGRAS